MNQFAMVNIVLGTTKPSLRSFVAIALLFIETTSGFHAQLHSFKTPSTTRFRVKTIPNRNYNSKPTPLSSPYSLCLSSTDSTSDTKVDIDESQGHDVPNEDIDSEDLKIQAALAEHQKNAAKLDFATEVRSLVEYNHGYAVISTNSARNPGYPGGSVIGFAPDESGRPLFAFSGMSSHTVDIVNDPRCSITIASKEFKGAADGRVNLIGEVHPVPESEVNAVRDLYLKKHPNAFWVNFGDFNFYRMDTIVDVRFVGGFARAGSITPSQYLNGKPDLIAAFGKHVADHMNDDHMDATIAMITDQIPGLLVEEARITSMDSLGMYVQVKRTPVSSEESQSFKLRLPFPRQATNRGDVKKLIVEMTDRKSVV